MITHVALLRAVNVGGTGVLPMADLKRLCQAAGFTSVQTLLQSGNVLFESALDEAALQQLLEHALRSHMGQPASVLIRTPAELRAVLEANPFPDELPAKVGVLFLPDALPEGAFRQVIPSGREELHSRGREVFIRYPDGMGRSRLKLPPGAAAGTIRNLNTVARLVALSAAGA